MDICELPFLWVTFYFLLDERSPTFCIFLAETFKLLNCGDNLVFLVDDSGLDPFYEPKLVGPRLLLVLAYKTPQMAFWLL